MKICPSCRHNNIEGYMYCEDCGEDLTSVESMPTVMFASTPEEPGIMLVVTKTAEAIHLRLDARNILGRYDPDRSQQPDVDLSDYRAFEHGVSSRHAVIQHTPEGVQIVDLGSTNGTYVNGRRLVPNQYYVLNDGDEIRFSRLVTRIRITGLI